MGGEQGWWVRLGQVAKGINPHAGRLRLRANAERERAETASTFGTLVSDWVALHLASRRDRYPDEAPRAIRHTFAALLKRPAARITPDEAVPILDQIVKDGKTTMAGRALAYARASFGWAEKRGKVSGSPFQGVPIATVATFRGWVLSDAEVADVWSAAGTME